QCRRRSNCSCFLSDAHRRQKTAIDESISWQTMPALVDPDCIMSSWTHYAIDRAAIISRTSESFLHPRNNRAVVTAIDRAVGVVRIARAVVIVSVVCIRVIAVRTVWIPIIRTAVVRISAVVRVSTVVPSVKWRAYTDVPKYAATTAPVLTAPVISVIATICHNCLAVPGLNNACFGERRRRQRKRDNSTEN